MIGVNNMFYIFFKIFNYTIMPQVHVILSFSRLMSKLTNLYKTEIFLLMGFLINAGKVVNKFILNCTKSKSVYSGWTELPHLQIVLFSLVLVL